MKIKILRIIIVLSGLVTLYNCSLKKMGVRATMPVLRGGNAALTKESDYELVKASLPGNLMMLQGLLEVDPENVEILTIAAQGFCSYAFGFVEDEDKERAKGLYRKGIEYGIKALRLGDSDFDRALKNGSPLWDAVRVLDDKDLVPAIMWTGQCIGNLVNLDMSDPENLIELPKAKALMEKVIELDDTYFYGSAHLFMAAYYAGLPATFGGGLDKAQKEFDIVFKMTERKFLLAQYFYAKLYATTSKDEKLFDDTIKEILETPSDVLPEQKLVNEIAKRKAKILLKTKSKYF